MNLDSILKFQLNGMTKAQLERAAEVFIHEDTSFAISDGTLYMSETSMSFMRARHAYINVGE